MEIPLSDIKPHFTIPFSALANPSREKDETREIIRNLRLIPHLEGGYFAETDRDKRQFLHEPCGNIGVVEHSGQPKNCRALSTSILYLLTPSSPIGAFHRNRSRTIHTLHRGRGVYVILKGGEGGTGDIKIESFVVGHDIAKGERLQWAVEGGCYKASFLIPDGDKDLDGSGLLISETVVPGFEYKDHDFLQGLELKEMVSQEVYGNIKWLLRENYTQGFDFP